MLACYPNYRQGVEVVAVYCAQGIAGFTESATTGNRTALSGQRWQEQFAFSPKEDVTEETTCRQEDFVPFEWQVAPVTMAGVVNISCEKNTQQREKWCYKSKV